MLCKHDRVRLLNAREVDEYLRPAVCVDGVAACDDFFSGLADFGGCGAALLLRVVLQLQP